MPLADYQNALAYPENMMVAQSYRGGRESQVYYFLGTAYEKWGKIKKQKKCGNFRLPGGKIHSSRKSFLQALSLNKLGKSNEATEIFDGLVRTGKTET